MGCDGLGGFNFEGFNRTGDFASNGLLIEKNTLCVGVICTHVFLNMDFGLVGY